MVTVVWKGPRHLHAHVAVARMASQFRPRQSASAALQSVNAPALFRQEACRVPGMADYACEH